MNHRINAQMKHTPFINRTTLALWGPRRGVIAIRSAGVWSFVFPLAMLPPSASTTKAVEPPLSNTSVAPPTNCRHGKRSSKRDQTRNEWAVSGGRQCHHRRRWFSQLWREIPALSCIYQRFFASTSTFWEIPVLFCLSPLDRKLPLFRLFV